MKVVETPGREQPFTVWDDKGNVCFFAKSFGEAQFYIDIRTKNRMALVRS